MVRAPLPADLVQPTEAPARRAPRLTRALDLAFALVAGLLLLSMLAAALHDVSRAWDVGYYHLPFAARLGGVLGPDAYVFHRLNQARFEGFPLFAELLQGVLWRLTGRAESVNLVAFAAVPLFAWFLRARFGVPLRLGVIGLLAIPIVHVHASSAYVDLPANAAASAVVLLSIEAWALRGPVRARAVLLALGTAAIAANTKFQTHPVLVAALAGLGARVVADVRAAPAGPARARSRRLLAVMACAMPLVFATPLRNAVVHHNPFYPVELRLLGHVLPGADTPYASSPPWLEHAPRPVRFACSVLEIGIRPLSSRRRWTVDQWMDDANGRRMGGFFGAYAALLLALFAWRVARERARRPVRAAAAGFALLTAITSVLPQSHELRYYLDWMIVLVALSLWLACDGEGARRRGAAAALLGPQGVGAVAFGALAVVLGVTRGGYAYPSGTSFADLVREEVDERILSGVRDGERVCTHRAPWAVLWAAPFHGSRRYTLKEAEEPLDCDGFRPLE
jgi:hypothetical protein